MKIVGSPQASLSFMYDMLVPWHPARLILSGAITREQSDAVTKEVTSRSFTSLTVTSVSATAPQLRHLQSRRTRSCLTHTQPWPIDLPLLIPGGNRWFHVERDIDWERGREGGREGERGERDEGRERYIEREREREEGREGREKVLISGDFELKFDGFRRYVCDSTHNVTALDWEAQLGYSV
jgi:hypothetical protein